MSPKVSIIGDSPLVTSGFAAVTKMVTKAFVDAKFDVSVLGCLDSKVRDTRKLPYFYYNVASSDLLGFGGMLGFLQQTKPDVLFMVGDPGTLANRVKQFTMTGIKGVARSICYFPVEGLPFQPGYASAIAQFDYPVTYCAFGMKAFKKEYNMKVDYAWHGMDHAPFEEYGFGVRKEMRARAGFTDDVFLVSATGVNKRTNRYPVLIEAMARLLELGHDDIYMYLHTSPMDKNGGLMAGWDLSWMIDSYGARDKFGKTHILFPPEQLGGEDLYRGISYKGKKTIDELLKTPKSGEGRSEADHVEFFGSLPFIARMNLPDMFIDAGSCHGFNLCLGEFMCCGVPCATVDDGFARSEIYVETGAAYGMKPSPTPDYWHTGAKLMLVDVDTVVDTILALKADDVMRDTIAKKGKEFAESLKWSVLTDALVEAVSKLA